MLQWCSQKIGWYAAKCCSQHGMSASEVNHTTRSKSLPSTPLHGLAANISPYAVTACCSINGPTRHEARTHTLRFAGAEVGSVVHQAVAAAVAIAT